MRKLLSYQVSVQNSSTVNVLKASQQLIQEKLDVFVAQWLVALDDGCQVRLHQFVHDVTEQRQICFAYMSSKSSLVLGN